MAKTYALEADAREGTGKGAARSLRRNGKTPAVIYGDGKDPVTISLDSNDINVEYNKGHMFTTLADVKVEKDTHKVLARDVQLHPVTDIVEHVDFLRVNNKTKIAVNVPIQLINENKSPGMKQNGVLAIVRHEVELICSAMAIPDVIEVDMEGKEHGDTIKISDAALPEGTKPVIDDRDFTIANLNAPKTAEQEEAELAEMAEGEEGAEGAEGEAAEGEEGAAEGEGGDASAEGEGEAKAEE